MFIADTLSDKMKYQSGLEKTAIVPKKVVRTFVEEDVQVGVIKRKLLISVSIELVRMKIDFHLDL